MKLEFVKIKKWTIKHTLPEYPEALLKAGYAPLLAWVLNSRGLSSVEEAEHFLNPSEGDPFEIKGMAEAVERVERAIKSGEKIAVYGDYDVDGITATALLTDYLSSLGADVTPYIPRRSVEGYGLNISAIDSFREMGISLIITVDCGITARKEADYARSIGIDMVITDHHECKEGEVPSCCAVIDCRQPGDSYENKRLAGVGMAFKLVQALSGKRAEMLRKYCDLLAIGTVADVMPLTGENRYYVKLGLEKINSNPRPGIKALLSSSKSTGKIYSSGIGFTIAPKLNAAGRLDRAETAFRLIMSSGREAHSLAEELSKMNEERQRIEREIWDDANSKLASYPAGIPIVLADSSWNQGVIGIAASRLAEKYCVPAIMIHLNGESGKGSCRSYNGFNLFEALSSCEDLLESFGGHALAAGLNIKKENITLLRQRLADFYEGRGTASAADISCDFLITEACSDLLSVENVASLEILEPFGGENEKPVFAMLKLRLDRLIPVAGKHSRIELSRGKEKYECIFFSRRPEELSVKAGDLVDIAFDPQINNYNNIRSVQLVLKEIRPADEERLCSEILSSCYDDSRAARCIPSRADSVAVWRRLEAHLNQHGSTANNMYSLSSIAPENMLPARFCICMKQFEQAGLISSVFCGERVELGRKADLEATEIMIKLKGAEQNGTH